LGRRWWGGRARGLLCNEEYNKRDSRYMKKGYDPLMMMVTTIITKKFLVSIKVD
jgi:hypothetical protein